LQENSKDNVSPCGKQTAINIVSEDHSWAKKRNKISNYLEKEQANLIDKNLLNINK